MPTTVHARIQSADVGHGGDPLDTTGLDTDYKSGSSGSEIARPHRSAATNKFLIGLPIVNFNGPPPEAATVKKWIAQRINQ